MYRVVRTFDPNDIIRCLPMEANIAKRGHNSTKEGDLINLIDVCIKSETFGFWLGFNDDKLCGYTIAVMSLLSGFEKMHLLRMYAKVKELKELFISALKDWMLQLNVGEIQITTSLPSEIRLLRKSYKFFVSSVNLERSI